MILCKASQTAINKAVCYKTKNEQLREKAVHFLLVAINCFYAGLPTVFCTITQESDRRHQKDRYGQSRKADKGKPELCRRICRDSETGIKRKRPDRLIRSFLWR